MPTKPSAKEAPPPSESIKNWLDKEAQFLTGILCGSCRSRKYRHHIYFQDAAEVLRRTLSLAAKTVSRDESTQRQYITRLLAKCIVAGESSMNELRLYRVDTIPVALALLAVMARLHALWTVVLESPGQLKSALGRQVQREQLIAQEVTSDASTIGHMVDMLTTRHVESGALQGRKRQREL